MEAGKRDITTVFNRARTLEIPFFQRSYVWKKENWERFADDLIAVSQRKEGYFLGSIILKQKGTSSDAKVGDARLVIDGQQRLTSLALFFRVLCDARKQAELFGQVFFNLAGQVTLRHNRNDIEVFEAALGGTLNKVVRERAAGNLVLGAFDYFRSRAKELAHLDPMDLINHVYFVGIDLGQDEDEQQIFDTINSLGVDLTTAELLKNELFDRSDLHLFETTWLPAFETDEGRRQYWSMPVTAGRLRRQNIDLFLQSFLVTQPGVPDEMRVGALFSEYKKHLQQRVDDRATFIRGLTAAGDTYRSAVDPESLNDPLDPSDAEGRMNLLVFGLQMTTVLPYFLHVMRTVGDAKERASMLRLVESFVMRRLIAGETNKHYNRFFVQLARADVNTAAGLVRRLREAEDPGAQLPSDDAVRRGFQETNLTNQQARVVLYLIEASIRDEERHTTTLAGYPHYTLEHVMPKKWRNHWDSVPEDRVDLRNKTLRKLGNLTLLSSALNREIRDSGWRQKKEGTKKRPGLMRYGTGLEIFDEDLKEEAWTEEQIVARGNRLASAAIGPRVWPLPEESLGTPTFRG
ncbi:MAG TPA: DUF262 domain-containing HNH endonuclease family protein [Longimicrobiales bacterium]|nr:DUF262 domain-containing HNH endonuclease family protein [Longimicrobiales bacterium]